MICILYTFLYISSFHKRGKILVTNENHKRRNYCKYISRQIPSIHIKMKHILMKEIYERKRDVGTVESVRMRTTVPIRPIGEPGA